jgi:hypothetical protein
MHDEDDVVARAKELQRRSGELVQLARDPAKLRAAAPAVAGELGGAKPVSVQVASANRKLAPQRFVRAKNGRIRNEPIGPFVVSTYVSIAATCPSACPFRDGGCYAVAGASHLTMRRMDRSARGWTPLSVTLAEASELDHLWKGGIPQDGAKGGRDLRLHVGGEVSCRAGARALGDMARRWLARGGGRVWTFTHRWREIPRDVWGPISVLASVESSTDVLEAHARGYAAAIVVDYFPTRKAFVVHPGVRAIPCPAEAGEEGRVTCSSCRLCLDADKLRERGITIAFAAHGSEAEAARSKVRA